MALGYNRYDTDLIYFNNDRRLCPPLRILTSLPRLVSALVIFHSTCLLFLSELSSASLGASILSISDEFFAEAWHLLLSKVAATYNLASFLTHGPRFLSRSLHKASKGNSVPMALSLTDGKPVDIILALTGKGFKSRSPGNFISFITGQSSNWERQEQ